MTSPEAFRAFHFFKYTYISNEHVVPTLLHMAGMWDSISDEWSSTLALWPKLKMRNTVLTEAHESLWKGKRILFGRKFSPEVDREIIRKVIQEHSPHIPMPWDTPQPRRRTAVQVSLRRGTAAADGRHGH